MIHVVLGTKAQLIKMAPVMVELQNQSVPWRFIFTGQHQKTIESLQSDFGIKQPEVVLHQGKDITSIKQMLSWFIKLVFKALFSKANIWGENNSKQDIVLVHGDTLSTLLGAFMARAAGKKVAHIESGLRSFNFRHPFPEELTRVMVFYLSHYYYAPGQWAANNLKKFKGHCINTEENTLLDSVKISLSLPPSSAVNLPQSSFAVVSIHRFENIFDQQRITEIVQWLEQASQQLPLLFILHPPTQQQLDKFSLTERLTACPNIELRPRYTHRDFLHLLVKSEMLISDGGSNQEECYYLGKPCLLLRQHTERKEGLDYNVRLCPDKETFLDNLRDYQQLIQEARLDSAHPSKMIVEALQEQ